ncbi:MAG: hypothetical protein J6V33_00640 [Bacteroidales bacterium]|nr:hypothetical protein [Bacteroidales bacterium]
MNAKKYILAVVGAMLVFTYNSCYKEGDLDPLKNPMRVEVDPEIGLPLIDTDIDIEKLLGLFSEDDAYVSFDENGCVIISYGDSMSTTLNLSAKSGTPSTKIRDTVRQNLEGEFEIDFFEDMELGEQNFSISDVLLSLECKSRTEIHDIPIVFRNIRLYMIFPDGTEELFTDEIDAIELNNLYNNRRSILENIDMSALINRRPSKFRYTLDLELYMSQMTQENIENFPEAIELDIFYSIKMKLAGQTSRINILDTMDFNLNLELDEIEIGDSKFVLELNNGLPLEFDLKLDFVDENHNYVETFFATENGSYRISSASVDENGLTTTSTLCKVDVPFSSSKIEKMNTAKHIIMSISIATTNNGTQEVAIQKDDHLGLRLGAIIKPVIGTDFDLGL